MAFAPLAAVTNPGPERAASPNPAPLDPFDRNYIVCQGYEQIERASILRVAESQCRMAEKSFLACGLPKGRVRSTLCRVLASPFMAQLHFCIAQPSSFPMLHKVHVFPACQFSTTLALGLSPDGFFPIRRDSAPEPTETIEDDGHTGQGEVAGVNSQAQDSLRLHSRQQQVRRMFDSCLSLTSPSRTSQTNPKKENGKDNSLHDDFQNLQCLTAEWD